MNDSQEEISDKEPFYFSNDLIELDDHMLTQKDKIENLKNLASKMILVRDNIVKAVFPNELDFLFDTSKGRKNDSETILSFTKVDNESFKYIEG